MYKGKFICKICEGEIEFNVRTNKTDYDTNNYSVLDKNNDGTFKCEINAKCDNCRITQRIYRDINFK